MEKMTMREFLKGVINGDCTDEMVEFATNEIAKLDAKNEKRKTTLSKNQKENIELKNQILDLLTNKSYVASEIALELQISTQKASALLKQLVEENKATCKDVKLAKKGKVKQYSIVIETTDEDDETIVEDDETIVEDVE